MRAHGKLPAAEPHVARREHATARPPRPGDAGLASARRPWHAARMSETSKPGSAELTELMGRVLEADASEAFGQFMVRHMALSDLAPHADDAVSTASRNRRTAGPRWRKRTWPASPRTRATSCSSAPPWRAGRRLHAAAFALLAAVSAARLPVEVTPEMVAVAAITELGDSSRQDLEDRELGAILGRPPGPLAQLGERRLDKPEVTGSSPVRPMRGASPHRFA